MKFINSFILVEYIIYLNKEGMIKLAWYVKCGLTYTVTVILLNYLFCQTFCVMFEWRNMILKISSIQNK